MNTKERQPLNPPSVITSGGSLSYSSGVATLRSLVTAEDLSQEQARAIQGQVREIWKITPTEG